MMKTRIYFLDNLRTFLIFLVILYHAGFSYQNALGANWIVLDPVKNDSIGLIGLYLDVFVMAVMFFISGYFVPVSAGSKSTWEFIRSKFKRIMLPWIVAVFTLIPIYKILFLYSRGLPQEEWFTYFHLFQRSGTDLTFFANDPSQHWLWFLPILFLFQILYLIMYRANLLSINISLRTAIIITFILGLVYSMGIAILGLRGWNYSPIFEFQRERLLIYFMFFLLGSLCYKLKVFDSKSGAKKYFILSNIILTVVIGIYTAVSINFLLNMVYPERSYFFISERIDGLAYYGSVLLLMFSFLHILIHTFQSHFNKINKIMKQLNKNSYYVYIIHMIVLGIVAFAMINLSMSVWIKYILLATLTFLGSNFLVTLYERIVERSLVLKVATLAVFVAGFFTITATGGKELPLDEPTGKDQTIGLHEAVVTGDIEAVKQHIKNGSDLNIKEPSGGSSPLITASLFGRTEIARLLIDAGADINLKNNDGSTALHTAAFFCRKDIVEMLLANGADKSIRNNAGSTALESVQAPFEAVKGFYDYFQTTLGPIGLELDQEYIKKTRPEIAAMLK